jgi:hypothetical protein
MGEILADALARRHHGVDGRVDGGRAGSIGEGLVHRLRQAQHRGAGGLVRVGQPLLDEGGGEHRTRQHPARPEAMDGALRAGVAAGERGLADRGQRRRSSEVRRIRLHLDARAHLDLQRLVRAVEPQVIDAVAEEVGLAHRLVGLGIDAHDLRDDALTPRLARPESQDVPGVLDGRRIMVAELRRDVVDHSWSRPMTAMSGPAAK